MKPTLLIGNDINNVNNTVSWSNLLKSLIKDINSHLVHDKKIDLSNFKKKPFPLLYEEIYMKAILSQDISETELKQQIAKLVGVIQRNEIHERITSGAYENLLTTNYEHSLEGTPLDGKVKLKNNGVIRESKYNIFRNHEIDGKKYWHIHGDSRSPNSIVLGYEHYSGQLQQMRNYVISGTNYKSSNATSRPLVDRLGKPDFELNSWIDLFFNSHVHILGLGCDFIESDLWWLFTIRARRMTEKSQNSNRYRSFLDAAKESKIVYYYPKKHYNKEKDQLMRANRIETVAIDIEDKQEYYNMILDKIETEYRL